MYGEARRERWGHSHLRKIVSAPSEPSLHAFLSLSDEADPHTSLTIVRRRCGRVGFPLGSHPWMLTVVHRRYGFRRVNVECTQADDSFYTTTGMNEKGKSQSERARRRGRADGVSRLFIFQAAHFAGRSTGERLDDTGIFLMAGGPFSLLRFFSGPPRKMK